MIGLSPEVSLEIWPQGNSILFNRILLESGSILESPWTGQTISLLGTYAVAQFGLYLLGAIVIKLSSATGLNLSLLTADFYTLIVGIQLFDYKVSKLSLTSVLSFSPWQYSEQVSTLTKSTNFPSYQLLSTCLTKS